VGDRSRYIDLLSLRKVTSELTKLDVARTKDLHPLLDFQEHDYKLYKEEGFREARETVIHGHSAEVVSAKESMPTVL